MTIFFLIVQLLRVSSKFLQLSVCSIGRNKQCLFLKRRNTFTAASPIEVQAGRGLVSDKGGGFPLSDNQLKAEFCNHRYKTSLKPTALVSVTTCFFEVLTRAFQELDSNRENANKAHAEHLARLTKIPEPQRFRNEYLFHREIPEQYVVHGVSVRTLLDRELRTADLLLGNIVPPMSLNK